MNGHIYEQNIDDARRVLKHDEFVTVSQPFVKFTSAEDVLETLAECRDASSPLQHWIEHWEK